MDIKYIIITNFNYHMNINMVPQTTVELRQHFIDYFRRNNHKFLQPSKVFNDDPTLLFVNAGMNQLKDVFLGKKAQDERFTRLTNSQICIRAGGKHNDLDDVGFDSYHLTSFEMLGNWSIDNYKKEEAIELAFNYLTKELGLEKDRLYVTYFEGTEEIPADDKTRQIWTKYVEEDHIITGNFKDNFWMMGDYGPCGVSTEIHYDLIGGRNASLLVNEDDPNVIEIWNNVFMEYNKDQSGYQKLDKFYVDTGMGLERLAMVLQNKKTIYQTDGFRFLVGYAQALSSAEFFTDSYGDGNMCNIAYRIFADHIRTTVVALFDGVEFGSNGRDFVLRKIFRRLLTYFYLYLNNSVVQPITNHPIFVGLIDDILNYHLKMKHNTEIIHNQLMDEEKLFIGKIKYVDRKVNKFQKAAKYQNKEYSKEEVFNKIKESDGIPLEILNNYQTLKFI